MTVSDILLRLDAERNRAEAEAARKRELFIEKRPELKELTDRKNLLLLDMLKSRLTGGTDDNIREQISALSAEINEKYGDWESALLPVYRCRNCSDTGYVQKDGMKRMCSCLKDRIAVEILGAKDIDLLEGSFESFDADVFKDPQQKNSMINVKMFAERAINDSRSYLVLSGKSGLGKSFILASMAKKLKKCGRAVLYFDSFDLFNTFHKKRLGENVPIEFIYDADALFIDDLGTEPMTVNVTREALFELISRRESGGKLTVIASNLTPAQARERYTEKVGSRLFSKDNGAVIKFDGTDLRR